jgi:hypothetical protein
VSFWQAMEALSRKTGLEPLVSVEDPYPRFQLALGAGAFWSEPHVVAGPVLILANDVQRANSVELGKAKHAFERELTINLTAFVEPGLRVLAVAPGVKVKSAVDEGGRSLKPSGAPGGDEDEFEQDGSPSGSVYTWSLAVGLECPPGPSKKIARLTGQTHVRVQTRSERFEVDDVLKARNLTRAVAGVPFIFTSLKKADNEYNLQLTLRRGQKSAAEWRDLHQSIFNGQMSLYDDKGRVVADRGTENGGDYGAKRIDATLRFVREPGIADPQAGEPFKLVWHAPTQSRIVPIEFELTDLPIPE